MDQIAKLVRESSDGAKQSAQACQDLSGLALDLQKMVGNFKLDDEHSGRPNKMKKQKDSTVSEEKAMSFAAGHRN